MEYELQTILAPHNAVIEIPYGELQRMLAWCKFNMLAEWDCHIYREAGAQPGLYRFTFSSERDYTTFLLWKS